MHNTYDHLGKTIGLSALSPCGLTEMEAVIAPEPRRADLRHVPDPSRDAERALLGLLGRIASSVCIIELYSGAPDEDDGLACLGKLIAFVQQLRREALKKREELKKRWEKEKPGQPLPPPEPFVSPWCWILAARPPKAVLARFAATAATGWPEGVYFGTGTLVGVDGPLRIGIVDASELPRDRSTLLVRFMAAGPLLPGAIADLAKLVTAGLGGSHYQRDHRGPVPIAFAALCDPSSGSGIRDPGSRSNTVIVTEAQGAGAARSGAGGPRGVEGGDRQPVAACGQPVGRDGVRLVEARPRSSSVRPPSASEVGGRDVGPPGAAYAEMLEAVASSSSRAYR